MCRPFSFFFLLFFFCGFVVLGLVVFGGRKRGMEGRDGLSERERVMLMVNVVNWAKGGGAD